MAGDFILSGYKADATIYFSTELNSLADGANKLGAAIDNSTNKYLFHDLEIYLASAAFTGIDPHIKIYVLPSVDGANYADGSDSVDPVNSNAVYAGEIRATTAAQYIVIRDVALPNENFKYLLMSEANVALASTGNTMKYRPHNGAYS
jgi:hypothetical protein